MPGCEGGVGGGCGVLVLGLLFQGPPKRGWEGREGGGDGEEEEGGGGVVVFGDWWRVGGSGGSVWTEREKTKVRQGWVGPPF